MEFHCDYAVRLITETKYSSLYKWCLQEIDSEGKKVGGELVPWQYSLYFDVINLRQTYSLERDDNDWDKIERNFEKAEQKKEIFTVKSSNVIFAELTPQKDITGTPSYSMIGTKRKVQEISLRIIESETALCSSWGTLRNTFEIDFREETQEDTLQFSIHLPRDQFEELSRTINLGFSDKAYFRVSGVRGFYSDWSPSISTDHIKILTRSKTKQNLELAERTDIDPPRLGEVSDFTLSLHQNHKLQVATKIDAEWEYESPHELFAEKQVEKYLKRTTRKNNSEKDRSDKIRILRGTYKIEILRDMFGELSLFTEKNDLSEREKSDLEYEIISNIDCIENAFNETPYRSLSDNTIEATDLIKNAWGLWKYPPIDLEKIKNGEVPFINMDLLSKATAEYLKLPVRNSAIDRMIVDALVTWEATNFARQMLQTFPRLNNRFRSPLTKDHPLWDFVKAQFLNFVIIALIPLTVLYFATTTFNFSQDWAIILGIGFTGLWALFFAISCFYLPSLWLTDARQRQKIKDLLNSMITLRREISGHVVSARHIRDRLNATTEQGAVWPAEVFAILDKIIKRGGFF